MPAIVANYPIQKQKESNNLIQKQKVKKNIIQKYNNLLDKNDNANLEFISSYIKNNEHYLYSKTNNNFNESMEQLNKRAFTLI